MEGQGLMIARFEGGPYDGLTLKVHGDWVDFQAMALLPSGEKFGKPWSRFPFTHELVPGQYVAQKELATALRVFKWDGLDVEAPGVLSSTDTPTFGDGFFERRTDGDRRAGHTMGRRSLRGDRREPRDHGVGWRELRRVEQRRDPKNQKREDH